MRITVAVAVALALAGCTNSPAQNARTVCTAYCECFVPAASVEACIVDDCLPDIPPVSDPCLDCVYENSQMCSALTDECTDVCLDTGSPLLGGM